MRAPSAASLSSTLQAINRKWAASASPTAEYVQETIASAHNCSKCDHHDRKQGLFLATSIWTERCLEKMLTDGESSVVRSWLNIPLDRNHSLVQV